MAPRRARPTGRGGWRARGVLPGRRGGDLGAPRFRLGTQGRIEFGRREAPGIVDLVLRGRLDLGAAPGAQGEAHDQRGEDVDERTTRHPRILKESGNLYRPSCNDIERYRYHQFK